jgi:hypothetical protein
MMPICKQKSRLYAKNERDFLTDSVLESASFFAILARMNAFRAVILALLIIAVGIIFYAFTEVIPARQAQYQMYQTQLKINEYEKRQQEHDARMALLGSQTDAPEVAAARAAAEEEAKKNEADLTAAEEHSVIASARRRQEIEEAATAAEDAAKPSTLGAVTAYLEDCGVLLFKADGSMPVNEGLLIAVRRNDYIVCEATVDGKDEESGQFTAALKAANFGGVADPVAEENRKPRPGDEVIVSPFLSSRELRLEGYEAPGAEAPESPQPLPEVEALLTPVP